MRSSMHDVGWLLCGAVALLCGRSASGFTQAARFVRVQPCLAEKEEASLAAKGAWALAEVFGRVAARRDALDTPRTLNEPPRSAAEVVQRIAADYEKVPPYYLSGNFDRELYADDCLFADDFASFKGRDRFEENLANLAGGFITESWARPIGEPLITDNSYEAKFLVRLRLALPWKPVLAWPWGVRHAWEVRGEDVLVVEHIESWDVSPREGLRQLFRPGGDAIVKPAASRAKNALGTKDPIAGPLVGAARSLGVLPESEAGGWTGEPLAWAEQDSWTQKLSAFTQSRLGGLKQFLADRVAGDYDVAAVDGTIDAFLAAHPVVLFSFTSCPFCRRAKDRLDELRVTYFALELDEDPLGPAIRAQLGRRTGRTSVPSIWISGDYIGGLNDGEPGLLPLDSQGLLLPKLRAARAMPT